MTEDEMVVWHHCGYKLEQALGDGEGQRSWCVAVHDVGYNLVTEQLPASYFCFTPKCNQGPRGRSQTPPVCGVETQGPAGETAPRRRWQRRSARRHLERLGPVWTLPAAVRVQGSELIGRWAHHPFLDGIFSRLFITTSQALFLGGTLSLQIPPGSTCRYVVPNLGELDYVSLWGIAVHREPKIGHSALNLRGESEDTNF